MHALHAVCWLLDDVVLHACLPCRGAPPALSSHGDAHVSCKCQAIGANDCKAAESNAGGLFCTVVEQWYLVNKLAEFERKPVFANAPLGTTQSCQSDNSVLIRSAHPCTCKSDLFFPNFIKDLRISILSRISIANCSKKSFIMWNSSQISGARWLHYARGP